MHDKEAIDMMQRCAADIRRLRAERDALAVPAEAYGVIRDIVGAMARRGAMCMGEDVLWTLEKRIRELEEATRPKPANPIADGEGITQG